jgi:hypothetical protein
MTEASFRGAGVAREPGTHEHRPSKLGGDLCSWFPGLPRWGIPE